MDLSPNDIRNCEFSSRMRGYDKEDVDNFLEKAAAALENARQENLRLSMEIDSLKSQISSLRQFEDTIKNAAIDARRSADTTVAHARKEAELIISSASAEALKLVGSRTEKITELEARMSDLELTKKSFISKLRSIINAHTDMIDEVAKADIKKNLTGDSIEVTESSDVTRKKLETIATEPEEKPIRTEEANAPEAIIAAGAVDTPTAEPSADEKTEQQPDSIEAAKPATKEQKLIDPELAAALETYKLQSPSTAEAVPVALPKADTSPKPGQFVETSRRAEDVPEGFVAKENDLTENSDKVVDTDKLALAPEAQDSPTEHHQIDINASGNKTEKKKITPDNLAEELDKVAAKFAEEIDKAEKD